MISVQRDPLWAFLGQPSGQNHLTESGGRGSCRAAVFEGASARQEPRPPRRICPGAAVVVCLTLAAVVLTVQMKVGAAEPPASLPVVQRILFLGNSITRHPPKPDIGWTGDWGMAASAEEKDYVHLMASALATRSGTVPELMAENISDFERTPDKFDFKARLEKPLAFKAEIIVVAIGENVPTPRNDAAKKAFHEHFHELLTTLKDKDGPAIFVRSCFWPDPAKDEILKQVSLEIGATFVDISALGKDPSNRASAEREIAHKGVAAHPGDKGMKAIAEALVKAIEQNPVAAKETK